MNNDHIINKYHSVNSEDNVRTVNNRSRIVDSSLKTSSKRTHESFNYGDDDVYPEKEIKKKRFNPVVMNPTEEDSVRDSLSNFSFLSLENEINSSGLKLPTVDSDKISDSSLTPKDEFPVGGTSAMEPRTNLHERVIELTKKTEINSSFDMTSIEKEIFNITNEFNNEDITIKSKYILSSLLSELFPNVNCKVLYTTNTDNLFFGIRCFYDVKPEKLISYVMNKTHLDDNVSCVIEFDSKLFDPLIGLNAREITAILLYTLYHTIVDEDNLAKLRMDLTNYFADSLEDLSSFNNKIVYPLLYYGYNDSIMKYGNPFNKSDSLEVANSPILKLFKYNGDMLFALKKLASNISYFKQDADRRNIILSYILRIIEDYDHMRIHAYNQINKCIDLTGSVSEKHMMRNVIKCLSNNSEIISEESLLDTNSTPSLNIIEVRNKIVQMKVDLMTVLSIEDLYNIVKDVNELINNTLLMLDNPYLNDITRLSWEDILKSLMDIKSHVMDTKDYLDRQHNSSIPLDYLNINENV